MSPALELDALSLGHQGGREVGHVAHLVSLHLHQGKWGVILLSPALQLNALSPGHQGGREVGFAAHLVSLHLN